MAIGPWLRPRVRAAEPWAPPHKQQRNRLGPVQDRERKDRTGPRICVAGLDHKWIVLRIAVKFVRDVLQVVQN